MNSSAGFILSQEPLVGVTNLLRAFGLYLIYMMIGTYDLLDFRNLNGQTARRRHDIHFPRYQFQHEADRKAFQAHPKRKTGVPRDEVRWIRRGTTWELSEQKASFPEAETERE